MCHSRLYVPAHPPQQHRASQSSQLRGVRKSVKATLRDLGSLKVAFTDLRRGSPVAQFETAARARQPRAFSRLPHTRIEHHVRERLRDSS